MNEGIVFDNNSNETPPGEATPVTADPQTEPQSPIATPVTPPVDPGFAISNGGNSKKLLIKIIIGIVAIILITFIVFLLIPRGKSNEQVTLVWWGLWEDTRVMTPIIADFERANPNIKVQYLKQNPEQYRNRLTTRITNGSGPDIFRYHNTWYPMLSDYLLPFSSDVISTADFKKDFYPVMQTDLVHNGAIYGIPLEADTLSLFVNKDILDAAGEKAPTRWDDFCKVASKVTVKDASGKIQTAGAALGLYGNVTHAQDIISMLFAQQGITMQNILTSPDRTEAALEFYTAFAEGGKECPAESMWNNTLDESRLAFGRGTLAMYFGYSWDIFDLQRINKDLNYEIHPVPSLVNKNETIASYWVEGVSRQSQHQKEALLFMQYLAKKETAQKFYNEAAKVRSFGEPSARVDLAASLKENKLIASFVSQLPQAQSSYFVSNTHDGEGGLNFLLNNYLGTAINQIEAGAAANSAVPSLNEGIGQVYTKYGIQ